MAFKKTPPPAEVPGSPDLLFLDLPRRKIPSVLPHQRDIMREYAKTGLNESDVALQLPTGSGKTLVGLLIAEWLRRRNHERVVYLCPTRNLVHQVVEQGEEKYGLTVLPFTGSHKKYPVTSKTAYRNADHVAVTTYSSLFNTNSFFYDASVLIFDDAHAAENYVTEHWSLRIDSAEAENKTLHTALLNLLRPLLEAQNYRRVSGISDSIDDYSWVDKLPTPAFHKLIPSIIEIFDANVSKTNLMFPWSVLRDHLHACHLYLSTQAILIRPLIAPTWCHIPFTSPRQRIYMSATLGSGGDLERLMGRRKITRMPIPDGWDRQGVGRRLFIFPGMSLEEDESQQLRLELIQRAGRSLILVPNDRLQETIAKDVENYLPTFHIFSASDMEKSTKPFLETKYAVAIMANRYDGIDFPGQACRLLFVEGLPKATNLQERFLMSRMGANVLFNERVQTRVLQAIGRCTRSLEDYSAVVVLGEELQNYLADKKLRRYLHPELQAELAFGVEQSKQVSRDDLLENFDIFYQNGPDWEAVNQDIVTQRSRAQQDEFPAIGDLSSAVRREVAFQEHLWQSDFESALGEAEGVISILQSPELRGYRALWEYLAGSAAWLGQNAGVSRLNAKANTHFKNAMKAATGISWLVEIARTEGFQTHDVEGSENVALLQQLDRVEAVLARLGTVHERGFAKTEKEILDGLRNPKRFEQAQKSLGELLGFDAGKEESEGSPDPWWIAGDICIVFEDYVDAQEDSDLSVTKARQASSHPRWMRENVRACEGDINIVPVLVTPVTKVKNGATPHIKELALWSLKDYVGWATKAVGIIRELRASFVEPGDLAWRADAIRMFEDNKMDVRGLVIMLNGQKASECMQVVG